MELFVEGEEELLDDERRLSSADKVLLFMLPTEASGRLALEAVFKLYGGAPANFLDVGGGATKENIVAAFKILTSDEKVEGILINIFGGIMKCDVIAQGTVDAVKEVGLQVPLVVRLEGTNVEAGKRILNESDVNVVAADDLDDAAQKIVAAVGG